MTEVIRYIVKSQSKAEIQKNTFLNCILTTFGHLTHFWTALNTFWIHLYAYIFQTHMDRFLNTLLFTFLAVLNTFWTILITFSTLFGQYLHTVHHILPEIQ